MFLISLTLFGITFALAFFSGFATIALDRILNNDAAPDLLSSIENLPEAATPDLESTVQFAVAATLTAQPVITARPITPASVDAVSVPTENPFQAFEAIRVNATNDVIPNADTRISITALSSEITDQFTAQSAQSVFPYGTTRLYIFFDYNNVPDDIIWIRTLYYENNAVYSRQELWPLDENGSSYVFLDTAFPPGNYEFQVSLGEVVINSYQFQIAAQS